MSKETVMEFAKKLEENKEMGQKAIDLVKKSGEDGEAHFRAGLVDMAKEMGYDLRVQDFNDFSKSATSGELSDEDLEAVAGGRGGRVWDAFDAFFRGFTKTISDYHGCYTSLSKGDQGCF
jgi:hypothetical protein